MPKRVSADALRVPLNCLIAPATKTAITNLQIEHKESQGEIVDRAIVLLAYGEDASHSLSEIVATQNRQIAVGLNKVMVGIPGDGPPVEILRPENGKISWRRGPRQKGDKTR